MARVNIETRAFAEQRFNDLRAELKWDRKQTIGLLACLWHDSQERLIYKATKKQILKFIDAPKEERESIFDHLLEHEYISKVPSGDEYEIRGNKKHVSSNKDLARLRSEWGRKGGIASRKKASDSKKIEAKPIQAEASQASSLGLDETLQFNSIQLKAIQGNVIQNELIDLTSEGVGDSPPQDLSGLVIPELFNGSETCNQMFSKVSKDVQKSWVKKYDPAWIKTEVSKYLEWFDSLEQKEPVVHAGKWLGSHLRKVHKEQTEPANDVDANRRCWEAYKNAYFDRWKAEPTRNQVVNSCIANFVKRVGKEDAPFIIDFYVKHSAGQYVAAMHSVNLAVRDAEQLRTQWLTGRRMTLSVVRNIEKTEGTKSQLERIANGEL